MVFWRGIYDAMEIHSRTHYEEMKNMKETQYGTYQQGQKDGYTVSEQPDMNEYGGLFERDEQIGTI